jgi:hypothetical protein
MKAVIRLSLLAVGFLAMVSCSKTDAPVDNQPPVPDLPNITSKIFPYTTQPVNATLGSAQTVFNTGDAVTLFVPYGVGNDVIVSSTLVVTDHASGDAIATFNLIPSTDTSAAQLTIPADLQNVPFMFVTFTADNNYTGKVIDINTSIVGNKAHSEDSLATAFSIQ